jgi:hypothetical protein
LFINLIFFGKNFVFRDHRKKLPDLKFKTWKQMTKHICY